uniref:CHHC U11-48K-type domain-containing protein n=1 Tax=Anopheles maculatus TaxID=74869 RepID=A0A182T4H4_9DIPT
MVLYKSISPLSQALIISPPPAQNMEDFESVIDLLECPYNPAHKLLSHTMARHVSRCRRAYGVLKIVQCPFNPEHQVPELEMTLHKLECEDREAFEQYKFCFTS